MVLAIPMGCNISSKGKCLIVVQSPFLEAFHMISYKFRLFSYVISPPTASIVWNEASSGLLPLGPLTSPLMESYTLGGWMVETTGEESYW